MTNTTNSVRVTKAQKYNAIMNILEQVDGAWDDIIIKAPIDKDGNPTKDDAVINTAILVDFCKSEMDLLNRKTKSENRKLTPRQKENEELKVKIMEYMAAQNEGKTCTDVMRELALTDSEGELIGNQRIARLMTALFKDDGKVKRNNVKGVAYFSMA